MAKKEIENSSNEALIIRLIYLYTKETKQARNEEKIIIMELAKRGVVDFDTMMEKMN